MLAFAQGAESVPHLTSHWVGYASISVFIVAYALVMSEEYTHLRKSKPVMLAAGIIWAMIAIAYGQLGFSHQAEVAIRHNLLEYAELMLFLLVAMTYINAMEERNVFGVLRAWMIRSGFTLRQLFWLTGLLAFLISPIADNLTTALLMCAVVLAVAGDNKKFILISCINIVVAANAGGAFSPFGDITTLMVWQKGIETEQGVLGFFTFFNLFAPSLVNWLVPAVIMSFAVGSDKPSSEVREEVLKCGGYVIVALFVLTIVTAVSFHMFLHLPPVIGMLTGLSYLQFFGFYLKKSALHCGRSDENAKAMGNPAGFDVFQKVARAEWDTLLFFYGVVLCVGGLGFIGYLALASETMYGVWGATNANIAVGILSAIVDNIPVMFAVLSMEPSMSMGQWLLVTMTAGVGGSLLSVGSAAGVALMGASKGNYTFVGHLKWAPVIALGYAASIWVHFLLNENLF
mgnify:CR=1 FL=1